MWDEGFMAQARASAIQQEREREEVYAALQYATSFHGLVKEWKDCDELKPQPTKKTIPGLEKGGIRAPNRVVCYS